MTNEESAVATQKDNAPLTPEEITAILAGHGAVDEADPGYIRMKVSGTNFVTDNDMWMTNPKTNQPAFVGRLLSAPVQYQAFYFDEAAAEKAGRPEMAKKFCKSHYNNPNENREYGTNGASCRECPFHPWSDERPKCSWKGDLAFQIIPEDGVLQGDEPIHELTLSTTGMIEYKGTKRDNVGGSVTDMNFMHRLAVLCINNAAEWGVDADESVLIGLNALNEGLVAAEFRSIRAVNEERGMEWYVVSLNPVHVQPPDGTVARIEETASGSTDLDSEAPLPEPNEPLDGEEIEGTVSEG
jgi:hypothetical protein